MSDARGTRRHRRDAGRGDRKRGDQRRARDRGTVTAELAIVLPAVVLVLVVAMTTAGAALAQVRCADAARAGARVAALGDDLPRVRSAVGEVAGAGAAVEVRRAGDWVIVRVERALTSRWGPLVAAAEARAWVEPGESGDHP
jgi:Flp pilus assembly protein TadG